VTTARPSKASRIAAWPCGRRTKWLVVVFWLIVVAVTGSLAGKLQGAERNDASSYLPASAESTQEMNLQAKFTSPNLNPAVVVYTRSSGITAADLSRAASRRCPRWTAG
jgi:putative drug exporter of the RND superfamily